MIKTTFEDDLGNHLTGSGTGFWINTEDGHLVFATNRHNVDPSLRFRDPTFANCRLRNTEVHHRHNHPDFLAYERGEFFSAIDPQFPIARQAIRDERLTRSSSGPPASLGSSAL
jgi:hypothetical protein